ncbi:MAG TPA: hypothetical protein VGP62_25970 [Bryobacteraceae bacterium]|jgi:hypothetical protein|nr:hypothetical protein [Bryobacteraceae bacterium]
MKKLFSTMLIALMCAGVLLAQDRVQKVVTIKNGNLNGIVRTIKELAPGSNLLISTDNEHIILSGAKEVVTGFEEIIKQLDVPPVAQSNVEIDAYMVVASAHADGHNPIPAELEPVVAQLKGLLSYKSFRLLDNFVLRARSGERGENSGSVQPSSPAPEGAKISYRFEFNRVRVDKGETARLVRFDNLHLNINVPVGVEANGNLRWSGAEIRTDVDVPEGKKVVIGKTSGIEGADSALILVISAKVVD